MATGAWAHNFPASKDEHPAYINYPDDGWDTIIASWFHEIFTALDAIQDALGYDITGAYADLNTRLEKLDDPVKGIGYYDRGDPAVYDWDKEDLTLDGNWHDLDLSGKVPLGTKLAKIIGHVEGNSVSWRIMFRTKGNVNEVNHGGMETLRVNVERHRDVDVTPNAARVIEYKADNQAWTTLSLAVRGWWIR